jgi:hypothetical protein
MQKKVLNYTGYKDTNYILFNDFMLFTEITQHRLKGEDYKYVVEGGSLFKGVKRAGYEPDLTGLTECTQNIFLKRTFGRKHT